MTIISVSNNSQLASALRTAEAGDSISVSSGTYRLSMSGEDLSGVTITAANAGSVSGTTLAAAAAAQVNFSQINLSNARGVTFDGVTISGNGNGTGLSVKSSHDITFENSIIRGFANGAVIQGTDGLTFRNNKISDIGIDGTRMNGIQNAMISGNSISLNNRNGDRHSDGMQFVGGSNSNVTIQNNVVDTNNSISHGIYAGNGDSSFNRNITIDHNTVHSNQVSGIAVGETNGLKITNNTVLKDGSGGGMPVIRVNQNANDVAITGNTTYKLPVASGSNWDPVSKIPSGWTIANNNRHERVPAGLPVSAMKSRLPMVC